MQPNCNHADRPKVANLNGIPLCSGCFFSHLRRNWYPKPGEGISTTVRVVARSSNGGGPQLELRNVMVKYPGIKEPVKSVWTPTRVRPYKNQAEKLKFTKVWFELKDVEVTSWGPNPKPTATEIKAAEPAPKPVDPITPGRRNGKYPRKLVKRKGLGILGRKAE